MAKRLLAMLAAGVALALAAGCGGGGDDDGPTRAEFIKEADAICQQSIKSVQNEFLVFAKKKAKSGASEQELAAARGEFAETIYLPGLETRLEELEALDLPDQGEEKVSAYLDTLSAAVEEGQDDPETLLGEGGTHQLQKASERAQAAGLKVCGTG